MTNHKHRKRKERADREAADQRLAQIPGLRELQRALAAPLDPEHPWYGSTTGRTGRAG